MRRLSMVTAPVVLVVASALFWVLRPVASVPSPLERTVSVAPAAPPPSPRAAPASDVSAAPAPDAAPMPWRQNVRGDEPAEVDPAVLERIRSDERFRDAARQQKLAAAADARWHEAVDGAGYVAADFDPAVRQLFRNITLEPRYVEEGRIEGLVIQSMVNDHPLAEWGFRIGDRIDRIQGVPLRDPAEIPSLLAHLGPQINICGRHRGSTSEFCRDVVLE